MSNPATDVCILVAEDNEMNQKVIKTILEKSGYKFILVNDGSEACSTYERENEKEKFGLILMDCQMPNMDGLKATKVIREFEKSLNKVRVPIVALTANSMKGDREICLAAGMDDFLSKPFRMGELVEKIKKWISETPRNEGG